MESLGFRVSSLGFRVSGLGFRVWGFRFRVLRFRVKGFWFHGTCANTISPANASAVALQRIFGTTTHSRELEPKPQTPNPKP